MRLAVVIPSRGLIHSRTIAAVHREAPTARLFIAHGRPIPDCFNEPITDALNWGATHVWVVEEDMHLPVGILGEMIAVNRPVVVADYPCTPTQLCVQYDQAGVPLFGGTGCMLATADTLRDHLPFTTDWEYVIRDGQYTRRPTQGARWGLHDVDFGMRLHTAGTPIHVIDTLAGQYRVVRDATPGVNDGTQQVELWEVEGPRARPPHLGEASPLHP